MKNNFFVKGLLVCSFILSGFASLTGCNNENVKEEEYVFELSGEGTINKVDYSFNLKGVEADNEFYIEAINTELEPIWGEWKFVEGKGYILTFDDAYWTEKKVKYDKEANQFYFSYDVNLGSAIGKTKVKFVGDAKDFAYDDEGWGFEPFEFSVVGADVFGMTTLDATLTCYENLTFEAVGSCPLIAVTARNGTYSFDKDTNAYKFIFTDQAEPVISTYDAEANSYQIVVNFNVGMSLPFTLTYLVE